MIKMNQPNLEEDYEAIYPDGWRLDPYDEQLIPVGLCTNMCSYEEMQEREKYHRLNKYEMVPDTNPPEVHFKLCCKEFKRSCVGREFVSNMDLRPWSVLKRCLHHLLLNICLQDDDWMFICDFVFDRLKAIRQDVVIQRIEGLRYIEILEGSVRFLVYSMFRLTCTLRDYSMSGQPFEVIVPPDGQVSGLNNYELNVVREMKLTMKCLRDCLSSLIIQYQEKVPNAPNRPLFEAINLVANLPFLHGHVSNPTEFQAKKELRNSDPMFKVVFQMYLEHLSGNHLTALKHLPRLIEYPLVVLAYAPAIASLQVDMVRSLKKAYLATGANTSPVIHLCELICPRWLDYDQEIRVQFGRFVATQFKFYDMERDVCDYKMAHKSKQEILNSVDRFQWDPPNLTVDDGINETRSYALQMVLGKNWELFQTVIQLHGIEYILNPSQDIH